MKNWFWKTLIGYTVSYTTKNGFIIFTHRPFKTPLIKFEKNTKINGLNYTAVILDDIEEEE